MNDDKNEDSFIKETKIIFKKFIPIKKIGKGSFGNVYSVIRKNDKVKFALKIEKLNSKVKILEKEAFNLFNFQGFGIPKFIAFGHNSCYNFLIEELLDKTLDYLFLKSKKKSNLIDICLIGIQILDRLEYIHSKKFIYNDIKPENFLIGINDPNVIYIIDFGLCQKYRSSKTGKHIMPRLTGKISGTLKYLSPNVVEGKEPSRRDDLISLGYMLIYLYKKSLPWEFYMPYFRQNIFFKIKELKLNNGFGTLFKELPDEFISYIKYTRNLKFEEDPDYSYLKGLFEKIIFNMNLDYRLLTFSWIQPENKIFFGVPRNKQKNKKSCSQIFKNILEKRKKISRNYSYVVTKKNIEFINTSSFINNETIPMFGNLQKTEKEMEIKSDIFPKKHIKTEKNYDINTLKINKVKQEKNGNIIYIGDIKNNTNRNNIGINGYVSKSEFENDNLDVNININNTNFRNKKKDINNLDMTNQNIDISNIKLNQKFPRYFKNNIKEKTNHMTSNILPYNSKISRIQINNNLRHYSPRFSNINISKENSYANKRINNIENIKKNINIINSNSKRQVQNMKEIKIINNYQNGKINKKCKMILINKNMHKKNISYSPSPKIFKNTQNSSKKKIPANFIANNINKFINKKSNSPLPLQLSNSKKNPTKNFITNNYRINLYHNYN